MTPRLPVVLIALAACGPGAPPADPVDAATPGDASEDAASLDAGTAEDAGLDAAPDDPDPVFSVEEQRLLESLRYDEGPLPTTSATYDELPEAQRFGQRLFFDPSLSGPLLEGDNDGSERTLGHQGETGLVSCAGCHVPEDGFYDTRSPHQQISLAALWTRRRSPTLLEVAFAPLYNWDGARDSIWRQAIGVMESRAEFNSSRLYVAQQIARLHRAEYESVFGPMPDVDDARYPQLAPELAGCVEMRDMSGVSYSCRGVPGDAAEYDGLAPADQRSVTEVTVNAAKAIAAYVRLLRCGEGRFDAWLDGDEDALTRSEQRGAALFVGRAGCVSCHSGPNLTDGRFHNVGLSPAPVAAAVFTDTGDRGAAEGLPLAVDDPLSSGGEFSDGDRGVLPSEVDASMEGAFRTPTLRCAERAPSYMHTGQLTSLEAVVRFFNRGGDRSGFPGTNELRPLALSPREQADLVAFLGTFAGPGPDPALLAPPP